MSKYIEIIIGDEHFSDVKVYIDGVEMEHLRSFSFEASIDIIPTIKLEQIFPPKEKK